MPTVVRPKHFGAPLGMYSHGMVAPGGEIVVVAGQVGMGEGGAVAVGDVGAQTRQALENVRAIVEAAGCTMAHIVRLQTFLTHAEDIPRFMAARGEVFDRIAEACEILAWKIDAAAIGVVLADVA